MSPASTLGDPGLVSRGKTSKGICIWLMRGRTVSLAYQNDLGLIEADPPSDVRNRGRIAEEAEQANSGRHGRLAGTPAGWVCVCLAACQPGPPPEPRRRRPRYIPRRHARFPGPPSRNQHPGGTVHFTAQGDIGVGTGAKKVLDVVAELNPQLNLALGDFSYKAGIEQQFCDMVTGQLGDDFPYQLVTGNHESDGHEGDIEKFVRCLPNKLPGLQGEYGTQWRVDVPEQNPVVRFILVSPGIDFRDGQPLDYSKDSERWRWTADAIDEAKSQKIPWTVVGMHVPCLSVGNTTARPGRSSRTC